MKRIVSVLMLCFALILGGCSAGLDGVNDDYKFDNLNAQLVDVDKTLVDLQGQIDETNLAIAELSALSANTDEALQAQIDALKAEDLRLSGELEALKLRVAANEGDIDALQTAVFSLNDDVAKLKVAVKDLRGRVATLESYVAKVNAPLFASVVVDGDVFHNYTVGGLFLVYGYWEGGEPGARITWTASVGGDVATSYDIYAIPVDVNGALGVPFQIANVSNVADNAVSNAHYFWSGSTVGLPVTFVGEGVNPTPLTLVTADDPPLHGEVGTYLFAVVAVDDNGLVSAPSVTADAKRVFWDEDGPLSDGDPIPPPPEIN